MYVVSNNTPKSSTLYFSTAKKNSKCGLPKIFFLERLLRKTSLKLIEQYQKTLKQITIENYWVETIKNPEKITASYLQF